MACTQASASAPPQLPKHLVDLQTFISKSISDVGRSVVRSADHDLALMHEDDFYLYTFLYGYFRRKALDQKRTDGMAISHGTVQVLLHKVLMPGLVGGANAKKLATLDAPTAAKTDCFPLLPQRTLREQLSGQKVVLDAFGEVIEVCNHLDALQGHKKAAFGMVNLLHFVAIAITLLPVDGVSELLQLVIDDADLPLAIKYKVVYVWSLIDGANAKVLGEVCEQLLKQATSSGYSYVDVAALPPLVMNGPAAAPAAPQPTTATASSLAHQTVGSTSPNTSSADQPTSSAAATAVVVAQGPRVVYHAADEDEGAGQSLEATVNDEGPSASTGDDDFWTKLAS